VLGGGFAPNDGVFQYKSAFAPDGIVDFYLRKRVLQPDRYQDYASRRAAQLAASGETPVDPDFFPAYRA
jgi:hypothetical protein